MARPPIQATHPTPANPPNTGNADADAAITELQRYPKKGSSRKKRPTGEEYEGLVARAEVVGPEKLLELLDDAAVETGRTVWDDEQIDALPAKERRAFKKDYKKAGPEIATRKGYLHWLIGAVCNTEAGLERAIDILLNGVYEARRVAVDALASDLEGGPQRRRVGEVLDLREWDGEQLGDVYQAGLSLLCEQASPAEVFERYGELIDDEKGRRATLLRGLAKAESVDPRWAPGVLASLAELSYRYSAVRVMALLEPDESWVEPLCAALPDPAKPSKLWPKELLGPLARVADERAFPYFVAALEQSWMAWKECFEGLRKIGDPAGAHVVRDFIEGRTVKERVEAGKALIAELEKNGTAPRPEPMVAKEEPRKRPVLEYAKGPKPKHPTIEPLEALERVYAKAFADAGLEGVYEKLAQRAVLMLPTRVEEAELELGATKLGGHPDLPARTKWPRASKQPLTFLAQIDLAEVAPLLPEGALPEAGLLSFFLANDPEGAAGYCEKAKVLFSEPGAELVRREVPEDFYDVIFQAAKVELHATVTLPSPTNKHVGKVLRGKKRDVYEDQVYEACDAAEPLVPQLLGFRRHGYDAEEPGTSEMLLQLPGDDQTDMEFGDVEILGIYLARKRLEAGDFSRVRPRLGDG